VIYLSTILSLHDKSEEEVSSAGEQLTSNRIYDGENTSERTFLQSRSFLFVDFIVFYGLKTHASGLIMFSKN
jgi:hypothetical protein